MCLDNEVNNVSYVLVSTGKAPALHESLECKCTIKPLDLSDSYDLDVWDASGDSDNDNNTMVTIKVSNKIIIEKVHFGAMTIDKIVGYTDMTYSSPNTTVNVCAQLRVPNKLFSMTCRGPVRVHVCPEETTFSAVSKTSRNQSAPTTPSSAQLTDTTIIIWIAICTSISVVAVAIISTLVMVIIYYKRKVIECNPPANGIGLGNIDNQDEGVYEQGVADARHAQENQYDSLDKAV
ncbi:hypothetical protein ACF0H5_006933 [Mactra antiquata]